MPSQSWSVTTGGIPQTTRQSLTNRTSLSACKQLLTIALQGTLARMAVVVAATVYPVSNSRLCVGLLSPLSHTALQDA